MKKNSAHVQLDFGPADFGRTTLAQAGLLSTLGSVAIFFPSALMFTFFRANPVQHAAELAYRRVVEQARQPGFFTDGGVPDTVDGRFELICLHAFLYLQRLKRERPGSAALGQKFFDVMFVDFDRALREMGTGDLSVSREIRHMAQSFYGRIAAYEEGLAGGEAALRQALDRNPFGTARTDQATLDRMARYVAAVAAALEAQDSGSLAAGSVAFPQGQAEAARHG
jgi:cytochrome b pre-mRNA-processing protein 3